MAFEVQKAFRIRYKSIPGMLSMRREDRYRVLLTTLCPHMSFGRHQSSRHGRVALEGAALPLIMPYSFSIGGICSELPSDRLHDLWSKSIVEVLSLI